MRLPLISQSSSSKMDSPPSDPDEMNFVLTEYEKFAIIMVASLLFLASVIITICVVSPICLFNRLLFNRCKRPEADGKCKQRLVIGESKHFQLKVVPLYGANEKNRPPPPSSESFSPIDSCSKDSFLTSFKRDKSSLSRQLTALATTTTGLPLTLSAPQPAAKLGQIFGNGNSGVGTEKILLPCIWLGVACERVDDSMVKLILNVDRVSSLRQRDYGLEPSVYVSIDITTVTGIRTKRRSTLAKVSASFRTNTAKRSIEPEFKETFTSSEFPKSILKDGRLKIKVMDDERYANDCNLGELTIPLKQFEPNTPMIIASYQMKPAKEIKGDLTLALCYLPTARRVTIIVNKASLHGQSHSTNYYVRALMFINGKLMKKKKTSTSQKLIWTEKDGLTFDLGQGSPDETAFLLVLSSSTDPITASLSSPSSPESPDIPTGSRKDRHIGHAVIGQDIWREMKHQPRKQINKILKLA